MITEYNPLTAIRKIETDLTSGKFGSLSPDELYSLEGKVRDAHSQVSEISNAQLYFLQLADERQQIKDTYRAKKEELNTLEERDELLSQHRSALATNQYLMGVAKSVQGKSFSDILYEESTNLKLKAKRSLALLSMLEADNDLILDAEGQLRRLAYRGLDTDSCHSFENAIKFIEEHGAVESNIKYRKSLEDVSFNIIERLNDIRVTPTISSEDLEVSLVDLLDPEDHPYEYLKAVGEGLAAGEFAAFTPAQLLELEDKFKWAYFLLPDEDLSAIQEDYDQTLVDFNDLQTKAKSADTEKARIKNIVENYLVRFNRNRQAMAGFMHGSYKADAEITVEEQDIDGSEVNEIQALEEADAGIEKKLLNEYYRESKENPQAWKGYKSGKYAQAEITVEEQEIDVAELNEIIALENKYTAEYAVTDLRETLSQGERTEAPMPGKYPLGRKKDDEKAYFLKALIRAYERANVTATQTEVDCSVKGVTSPTDSISFKAYGVVPAKREKEDKNRGPQTEAREIYFAELGLEKPKYIIPSMPLEEVVVEAAPKKSKIKSLFAQAAFIAGGVLAAFLGYQAIKRTADAPIEHYHGTPAVEVVAPKAEAKSSAKLSEVKKAGPQTKNIEVTSMTIVDAAKVPQKKAVKSDDELHAEWTNSHDHIVLKGDTIAGLWNNEYQGNLAFDQYLEEVRSLNPQLKSPDKIWPGQILNLPK